MVIHKEYQDFKNVHIEEVKMQGSSNTIPKDVPEGTCQLAEKGLTWILMEIGVQLVFHILLKFALS